MDICTESYSSFLAKQIDDMFINDFGFDIDSRDIKKIMSCFAWVNNVLYITCFERPKFVLAFESTPTAIKVRRVSRIMALTWGMVIKSEINKF